MYTWEEGGRGGGEGGMDGDLAKLGREVAALCTHGRRGGRGEGGWMET